MIASSNDNSHPRALAMQTDKIVRIKLLYRGRWLMYVEYISTHQQRVWLKLRAPSRELIEEVLMLINAVIILINDLSKM